MTTWALDLGTTNTGLARWDETARRPHLVELPDICRLPGGDDHLQAPRLVPSATEILPHPGLLARLTSGGLLTRFVSAGRLGWVGRPALDRNEAQPRPGFVPSFKPDLATDALRILAHAGGRTWTARDVARVYLRELLAQVRAQTGERVRDLVITTPVDAYESYRAELLQITRSLGVKRVRFIDEPVAAAIGYDLGARARRHVLVVDFGAGTLDLALVSLTARELQAGACEVLAKEGRPLGGRDVDRWLLERFCERLEYPLRADDASEEARFWYQLMLAEARRVKEAVFFREAAEFTLTPPDELRRYEAVVRDAPTELTVTKGDVRELLQARGVYQALDDCLDGIAARAAELGLAPEQIDDVLLVGGSTLLPDVYSRIEARFGRDRVRGWKPFEAVAWGAAAFAAGRFAQSDFIVHDYAFVTYDRTTHEPHHTVIVPRGTRVPTPVDLWKRALVPTCSLGEPESIFKLVICELGRSWAGQARFGWDAAGTLHALDGSEVGPLVVPLNEANPTLGRLAPPHEPGDSRPRLEVAFGVNTERWLVATVRDLRSRKVLMREEPVVRLL